MQTYLMNILNYLFVIVLCFTIISVQSHDEHRENSDNHAILSRKRRYLIFPSGATLQVVYCGIFPIVDFTNLFIMGVTTALAWALPDQPQYISEYLQEQYENGTLPLLDRKDNDVADLTYSASSINTNKKKPISNPSSSYDNYHAGTSKRKNYYDSYYGGNSYQKPTSSYDDGILNEINKYSSKHYQPWRQTDWSLSGNNAYYSRRRNGQSQKPVLRVYPALGKRSADVATTFDELFYINHHRDTRHNLYNVIEKYLVANGKNGDECIQKALCETGRKQHDDQPGTFVGEIMRTIFSLPSATLNKVNNQRHKRYDKAYFMEQNCTKMYPKCEDSLYEADFIF